MSNKFHLNSEEETHALAAQIAIFCKIGDVITLQGGLGVGKSSFARGFINQLLQKPTQITSPTFNLIHTYDVIGGEIWHCDFYRLDSLSDILQTGIEDGFNSAITLIEWPELIQGTLPADHLNITLEYAESSTSRNIIIQPYGRFKQENFSVRNQ